MKLRRILLKSFCCIVSLVSAIPAWGGGGGTTYNYYAKVTANVRPTGAGTVYAQSPQEQGNGDEAETSTATGAATQGGANVRFTFTATPQGNYDFKGWTSEDNVNATPLSLYTNGSVFFVIKKDEIQKNFIFVFLFKSVL
mgnify:CR=1 FL=1